MTEEKEGKLYEKLLVDIADNIGDRINDYESNLNKNFIYYRVLIDLMSAHLMTNTFNYESILAVLVEDIRVNIKVIEQKKTEIKGESHD